MSDDKLGLDEKRLVLQFLGVLHTWIQDQRRQREEDFAVLQVQESLVKLLFARVSRPDLYSEPSFTEAGELIFGGDDEDWHDVFAREQEALHSVGVELTESDMESAGDVIDFFTRQKVNKESEESEEERDASKWYDCAHCDAGYLDQECTCNKEEE